MIKSASSGDNTNIFAAADAPIDLLDENPSETAAGHDVGQVIEPQALPGIVVAPAVSEAPSSGWGWSTITSGFSYVGSMVSSSASMLYAGAKATPKVTKVVGYEATAAGYETARAILRKVVYPVVDISPVDATQQSIDDNLAVLQHRGLEVKSLVDWMMEAPALQPENPVENQAAAKPLSYKERLARWAKDFATGGIDVKANVLQLLSHSLFNPFFNEGTPFSSILSAIKDKIVDFGPEGGESEQERLRIFTNKVSPEVLSIFFPNGPDDLIIPKQFLGTAQEDSVWGIITTALPSILMHLHPFLLQTDKKEQLALAAGKPYETLARNGFGNVPDKLVDLVFNGLKMPRSLQKKCTDLRACLKATFEYTLLRLLNHLSSLEPVVIQRIMRAPDHQLVDVLFDELQFNKMLDNVFASTPNFVKNQITDNLKSLVKDHLLPYVVGSQRSEILPYILQTDLPKQLQQLQATDYAADAILGGQALTNEIVFRIQSKLNIQVELPDLAAGLKPYVEYVVIRLVNKVGVLEQTTFDQLFVDFENLLKSIEGSEDNDQVKQEIRFFVAHIFKKMDFVKDDSVWGPKPFIDAMLEDTVVDILFDLLYVPIVDLSDVKIAERQDDALAGTTVKLSHFKDTVLRGVMHYQLDKNLDNVYREENGHSKIVNKAAKLIRKKFDKKWKGSPLFANYIKGLVDTGRVQSLLEIALAAANPVQLSPIEAEFRTADNTLTPKAAYYRNVVINLFYPIATNLGVDMIEPILEMEKRGGKKFDRDLVLPIVPLLITHIQNLRNETVEEVQSGPLQELVYKAKVKQAMDQFLPGAKDKIHAMMPTLSNDDFNKYWYMLVDQNLADVIPQVLESIFDQDMANDLTELAYKSLIETFTDLTPSSSLHEELTPELIQMNNMIWELLVEGGRFSTIPIDKIMHIASYVPGNGSAIEKAKMTVGKAMRKQLNGSLIEKNLAKILKDQAKKQHVLYTAEEKVIEDAKKETIVELERQVIEKGLEFGLRSIRETIDETLKIFDFPIVKELKDMLVAICSFILVRIVGGLLRVVGIEAKLVNYLCRTLEMNKQKINDVFIQPKLHERVVLDALEHVGGVIAANR